MMSAAGTPSTDPWVILPRERMRYEEQFRSLKPNNGIVTGDQAKGFFLQSQLPPIVLGHIWALADTDQDGKMDINEFSIACKLINLKLRGYDVPKGLPPSLIASLRIVGTPPAVPPLPNAAAMMQQHQQPQGIGAMGGTGVVPPPRPPDPPRPTNAHVNQVGMMGSTQIPSQIPSQVLPQQQPNNLGTLLQNFNNGMVGGSVGGGGPNLLMQQQQQQQQNSPLTYTQHTQHSQQQQQQHHHQQQPQPPSYMGGGIPTGIVPPMQGGMMPASVHPTTASPMTSSASLIGTIGPPPGLPPPPGLTHPSVAGATTTNIVQPIMGGAAIQPQQQHQLPLTSSSIVAGASAVPPVPVSSVATSALPSMMTSTAALPPSMSPAAGAGVAATAPGVSGPPPGLVGAPGATSTPRSSITGLEKMGSVDLSSQLDWVVPHQTKLKYTQIFNTTDRTRSGYLSGAQARNVMVQTKLPQNVLAQIWALSDMDSDGRLGCEEFVLAMHLCEQALAGNPPPAKLPPDLIPPSFRRGSVRTASISSQGSGVGSTSGMLDQDPASTLLQTSFEDKRKENFEKGQAELERRRKALLDQQRKEAEERERKEREEIERREKARQEVERKRIEELERQMREQQEQERQKEEERKRQAEQRESARREMERQRQLEWEKQRLQELQHQRQREQETVLKMKAKNQSLTIELSTLNDQVKELSQKICDTRTGVSNVKTTIDGMRSTRDSQMQEMSQLKNKLKEQNTKLLALSQEKVKLEAKNKINASSHDNNTTDQKIAYENKEINIKNLREKIEDMHKQIEGKLHDIDNNNLQLGDLRTQLATLVKDCEKLYSAYEEKRDRVIEMKTAHKSLDYGTAAEAWKTDSAWGDTGAATRNNANATAADDWPVETTWSATDKTSAAAPAVTPTAATGDVIESESGAGLATGSVAVVRYRALYEFVARNSDEVSFQPGDIINVPVKQTGEPGWLAGEIRGHTGWFPESYVEPIDGAGIRDTDQQLATTTPSAANDLFAEEAETKRLEGIAEVPEVTELTTTVTTATTTQAAAVAPSVGADLSSSDQTSLDGDVEYYIANYPYQSQEQGDLTFNAGEVITVVKKDGEWWTGKLGTNVGIFPSNYVTKVDVNSTNNLPPSALPPTAASATNNNEASASTPSSVAKALENNVSAAVESAAQAQVDNEVSQINENHQQQQQQQHPRTSSEKSFDSGTPSNTQTLKGSKKPEIASVIAPYQATSPEQLSLARGQLIMIRKKTDSGWWEGELQAKGRKRQVGWFPASYVKVLNSSGRVSGRTTPVSTTRMQQEIVIDKVIALFPYTALNPDELSFAKDDIISVTAREEEAWWRGELNGVSGLFPSNYVTPLQQQSSAAPMVGPEEHQHQQQQSSFTTTNKNNKKRQESIRELVRTEKAYVDDMTVVHEVFELPLKRSSVVGREEIDRIFVNWQTILQCNRTFQRDLEDWTASGGDIIGDVIRFNIQNMRAYETFCGQQLDSAALLQRLTENSTAFRDLVRRCQNNVVTKGMPLSSFLIKPMQRITKYPLLIGKILENTPQDHPDYEPLQEALRSAEKFLNDINENVRQKENQDRFNWLQRCAQNDLNIVFNGETNKLGPRKLLHYGVLIKVKSGKELVGFLFNDFFFLIQPNKSLGGTQFTFQMNNNISYKMYKQPILVQDLSVSRESTDTVEQGTDSNRVLKVQDNRNKYSLSLLASTVNECNLWVKRIEGAKEVFAKVDSLTQNRPKTRGAQHHQQHTGGGGGDGVGKSCGRLLVLVQKGKRFVSSGKPHSDNVYCKVTLDGQTQQTGLAKDSSMNGNTTNVISTNINGGGSGGGGVPQVPALVWNCSMQFQLRNLEKEVLSFVVYGQNLYSPDEFLGRAELKVSDILRESQTINGPITKKLILHQVESGEIVVKLDLHMFNN